MWLIFLKLFLSAEWGLYFFYCVQAKQKMHKLMEINLDITIESLWKEEVKKPSYIEFLKQLSI